MLPEKLKRVSDKMREVTSIKSKNSPRKKGDDTNLYLFSRPIQPALVVSFITEQVQTNITSVILTGVRDTACKSVKF